VDYSKWDNLNVSDSEDEENDEEDMAMALEDPQEVGHPQKPRVTKLEGPTSVTIGAHGERANHTKPPGSSSGAEPGTSGVDLEAQMTRNGSREGDRYMWSQTKEECLLSVIVPPGTKARDISIKFTNCDFKTHGTLEVGVAGSPILTGTLGYGIDKEEGDDIEWEIKDFEPEGRRVVQLTFVKKVPERVVVWWSRVLAEDAKIDTTTIADRDFNTGHHDAWKEAHAAFQAKMKNRKPTMVDC